MVPHFGDYDTTETVYIPFNTFTSDDPSASVTITNLVAGDVEIHKDGGTIQRSSDAGVTVTINFDSVTGNHMVSIDLSDNSDAGFYAAGSRYQVRMEGTTIDGATVNAWIGTFSIGCVLRPTTDGRTLDVNANGEAGLDLDNTSGTIDAAQLGADCITAAKIADDAIAAEHIAAGAIVAATFAADVDAEILSYIVDDATKIDASALNTLSGHDPGATIAKAGDAMALANGAITNASLAGNMEIVFETDFATNYNQTRNAWVTNAQDFVGTTAADPFSGQVVSASVTDGVTLAADQDVNVTKWGGTAVASAYVLCDLRQIGGDAQSATDLKDFADAGYDPLTNKVQGVVLVDTTSVNTDMRGTDLAALAATALSNVTWTDALAGYIGNLNVGGNVASQADVQGITQAQRVRILPAPQMERPDSGSTTYRVWVYAYNEAHEAEDLDSSPTITVENNTGTDRSANLSAVTKPGATTGQYYADYTVADSHAIEGLLFKCAATEGGTTVNYAQPSGVVDTTAVDFTASDRATLNAIAGDVENIDGDAMRGTDGANTATPLDADGVRTAVGLAAANLDAQLSAISGYVDCLPATLNDPTADAIAAACRDAILNRLLAGNHDVAGTLGKILQLIDGAFEEV